MILVVLWLIAMASSYTMGGLIHIFPVIAVVDVLVPIIQGRRQSKIWYGWMLRGAGQRDGICGPGISRCSWHAVYAGIQRVP